MTASRDSEGPSPTLRCWFCGAPFASRQLVRDGILRSRTKRDGGPYHLYPCPECNRENACEKTPRGRWFASPHCRITLLDYVLAQFLDPSSPTAETLLAAIAWLRDNEERRRYFFEVDGDPRYRQGSWLRRLWAGSRVEAPAVGAGRRREEAAESGEATGEERREARQEAQRVEGAARAPHKVLGVRPGASAAEIRAAFRRLALHYHPDKVIHLGEDFERAAHEKFLELKEAYEALQDAERRKRERREPGERRGPR